MSKKQVACLAFRPIFREVYVFEGHTWFPYMALASFLLLTFFFLFF